jgi:hypothetical protein
MLRRLPTAQIASSNLLEGEQLYLKRARKTLPYLIRQAKAGQPIYYSDLAKEIGIPNPRNLNYILGAIGNALIELGKKTGTKIPQIQCITLNKQTNLLGDGIGWFIDKNDFNKLSRSEKQRIVSIVFADIYSFQKWDDVLNQLGLEPIQTDIKDLLQKAKQWKGYGGGESSFHFEFKNFIAANPTLIGLPRTVQSGSVEYKLPSSDVIDILFLHSNTRIGVEVKSKISNDEDILRGIFQCIKYKYLIEAEQIVENKQPDSRVILVLEAQLPAKLTDIKNILGIEVIDNVTLVN